MAERVVKVTLSARVAEYNKGMQEAAQATRKVGTEAEKLAQTREAMQELGQAGVAVGTLLTAGVGVAIAKFAEFDQQMSYVQAATNETAGNMELLREAALEAGASTVFSATESAAAIEELSKAGISTTDILGGGLKGALDLAAAGGLDVAQAAEIAATTMQQFRLSGEDATHVADLLAAGAAKAMGDVNDMAQALNQSGLVAAQFGLSVEETTGTLAAFAQAGLLGSDAGTSFRTMLLRMANPTEEVKKLMADIGFEAYNTQGQFIGLAGLAGELETSLAGMTDAQRDQTLAMIFGQDAIRAANILLREGEEGIRDWTTAVDDQGFAAETAATRLDNLLGDWEAFTGALDTAFIQMGEGANGPLRELVQGLTMLVEGFTELPEWVQQGTLLLGAAVGAIALAGGAALIAVPKIVAFRIAMQDMGGVAGVTRGAMSSLTGFLGGPWGIALTAAVGLATVWISTNQRMASAASEFRDTLDDTTGALTDYTTELIAKKLQEAGAFEQAEKAGISQRELTEAIAEGGKAYDDMLSKLRDAHDATGGFDSGLGNAVNTVREMGVQIEDAKAGFENIEAATEGSTEAADENTEALAGLGEAAEETQSLVDALAETIRNFGSAQFDVEQGTIAFYESFNELDALLKEGAGSLDVTTEAGQKTLSTMLGTADATNEYAASVAAMGGSTEEVQGILDSGRQKIIDTRIALGDSEEAARAYADRLIATPEAIQTTVQLNGAEQAAERLRRFAEQIASIPSSKTVAVSAVTGGLGGLLATGSANGNIFDYAKAFANGGGVDTGIYQGRTASIHKFAEPETIWEAYISGKPDQRDRNIGIWQETGRRLGVESAPAQVSFPDRITLVDDSGSILTHARVIADGASMGAVSGLTSAFRGGRRV